MAFLGHGCAISQASTSIMIDTLRGKTIEQAKEIIKTFIEKYDRKTKKSTYTVEVKGRDMHNKVDMNIKYRFTSKDAHMTGTGCAGEMSNDTSYITIHNVTNVYEKEFRTFEKLSNAYLYNYYELTKAEIKKTKISHLLCCFLLFHDLYTFIYCIRIF